jgi:predicted lactoylglutathione lyase
MIGYVTLGTNDMTRAARFYDDLLAVVGAKRSYETEKFIAWGTAPNAPMLFVIKPADGNKATIGNGVMVALAAKDKEEVDKMYNKAISLGRSAKAPRVRAAKVSTPAISATPTATSSARSSPAEHAKTSVAGHHYRRNAARSPGTSTSPSAVNAR